MSKFITEFLNVFLKNHQSDHATTDLHNSMGHPDPIHVGCFCSCGAGSPFREQPGPGQSPMPYRSSVCLSEELKKKVLKNEQGKRKVHKVRCSHAISINFK